MTLRGYAVIYTSIRMKRQLLYKLSKAQAVERERQIAENIREREKKKKKKRSKPTKLWTWHGRKVDKRKIQDVRTLFCGLSRLRFRQSGRGIYKHPQPSSHLLPTFNPLSPNPAHTSRAHHTGTYVWAADASTGHDEWPHEKTLRERYMDATRAVASNQGQPFHLLLYTFLPFPPTVRLFPLFACSFLLPFSSFWTQKTLMPCSTQRADRAKRTLRS